MTCIRYQTAVICLLAICFGILGCSGRPEHQPEARIAQVSTIDALLAGVYDGAMTLSEFQKSGDHGIGTFDALDGEMLLLDGTIYRIDSRGKVTQPNLSESTPFAAACFFHPDSQLAFSEKIDYETVQQKLNQKLPNQNIFYAFRMDGDFSYIKTRSVPRQKKPYPPLAEVTKHQPIFERKQVSGTIFGFRCPAYVKGVNVPGYHVHFVSQERDFGGHVLAFRIAKATVKIQAIREFMLQLPEGQEGFSQVDLSKDRAHELKKVEQ